MEDPATWGTAEKIIHEVIGYHAEARTQGVIGLSLESKITNALREAGLLSEQPDLSRVTRFEVIDHRGGPRSRGSEWGWERGRNIIASQHAVPLSEVSMAIQDEGCTLKIFLRDKP